MLSKRYVIWSAIFRGWWEKSTNILDLHGHKNHRRTPVNVENSLCPHDKLLRSELCLKILKINGVKSMHVNFNQNGFNQNLLKRHNHFK